MTATNHALTGAIIGLVVGEPLIAIPLSIASHFICDALPHFSSQDSSNNNIASQSFFNYLVVDAGLCFFLVVVLAIIQPENWPLAAVCAFLAASPDFGWINRFRKARSGQKWHPSAFSKFAASIQWFQRPIGAAVEIVWFVGTLVLIAPFLS